MANQKEWVLTPPPGMRFVNHFRGDVILQFPEGKEEELATWLHGWVEHMLAPHVFPPPIWTEQNRQEASTAKETPQAKGDTEPPVRMPQGVPHAHPQFPAGVAFTPPAPQGGEIPVHHLRNQQPTCGNLNPPINGVTNWALVTCQSCLAINAKDTNPKNALPERGVNSQ